MAEGPAVTRRRDLEGKEEGLERGQSGTAHSLPKSSTQLPSAPCFLAPRRSAFPIRRSEIFLLHCNQSRRHRYPLREWREALYRPRKVRKTVHMQQLSTCHSNIQFSQQPLTAFESTFIFPDRCNSHKRMQRQNKYSVARIGKDDFRGGSPLVMLLHQYSDSLFSQQPLTAF
jgi:hypothetical protein